MENIISSLVRFTKKQVDSAKKAISKYAGQVINLVPEPILKNCEYGYWEFNDKN